MKRRSGAWKVLAGMALALVAAALVLLQQFGASMDEPSRAAAGTRVQVHTGASVRSVLAELAKAQAVRRPRMVEWYLRLHGQHLNAQAGIYELAEGASARTILRQINAGQVVLSQLTIIEGWTFAQMRSALNASADLAHEWRELDDGAVMSALGRPGVAAEGRFYPDTYRFAAGTADRRIYELAIASMRVRLQQEWLARAPGLPLDSADTALILASVVEKETAREDERAKVAAVFINRLRIGMRLQSDPTIIYGLGARYDGNLRRRDLEADGPYNSYTRYGLPPTPIALPGGASIHAVLHPLATDSLYFVATGKGDGSHHFSASYAEHSAALRQFLRRTHATPDRAVTGRSK